MPSRTTTNKIAATIRVLTKCREGGCFPGNPCCATRGGLSCIVLLQIARWRVGAGGCRTHDTTFSRRWISARRLSGGSSITAIRPSNIDRKVPIALVTTKTALRNADRQTQAEGHGVRQSDRTEVQRRRLAHISRVSTFSRQPRFGAGTQVPFGSAFGSAFGAARGGANISLSLARSDVRAPRRTTLAKRGAVNPRFGPAPRSFYEETESLMRLSEEV